MLITLFRRTVICQSVAEVQLTGVAPLGAVSHRFKFNFLNLYCVQELAFRADCLAQQCLHCLLIKRSRVLIPALSCDFSIVGDDLTSCTDRAILCFNFLCPFSALCYIRRMFLQSIGHRSEGGLHLFSCLCMRSIDMSLRLLLVL